MGFNPNMWPVRLSPSGPFIRDADSGAPLPIGPGSIGVVLRAQGTSGTAVTVSSSALTPVTGLESIPTLGRMPRGYHYDVKAIITVLESLVPAAAEPLVAWIEYSEDNGGTWSRFADARCNAPTYTNGAGAVVVEEIDVDRTGATALDVTHLRLQLLNTGGTGVVTVQPGLCTLRVEQYINDVPTPT